MFSSNTAIIEFFGYPFWTFRSLKLHGNVFLRPSILFFTNFGEAKKINKKTCTFMENSSKKALMGTKMTQIGPRALRDPPEP